MMVYSVVLRHFNAPCPNPNAGLPPFQLNATPDTFPSLSHHKLSVLLCFEHFHPILSIMHLLSLDLGKDWRLALGEASIGC
jgi:hypothetical protein